MERCVTCQICMEVYDQNLRCPRVLLCGHSFCSNCIEKFMSASPKCPTCLMPIANGTLESISVNYCLKELAVEYTGKGNIDTPHNVLLNRNNFELNRQEVMQFEGFCEMHKIQQRFRCMSCCIWICGECVAISHKYCKTLLVKEAFKEMKENQSSKILNHIEMTPKGEENISLFLVHYNDILEENVKELERYQKKMEVIKQTICGVNQKVEKMLNMKTVLISLKEKLENQMKVTNAASSIKELEVVERQLTKQFNAFQEIITNLNALNRLEDPKTGEASTSIVKTGEASTSGVIPTPFVSHQEDENAYKNLTVIKEVIMDALSNKKLVSVSMKSNGNAINGKLNTSNGNNRVHCTSYRSNVNPPVKLTIDQCLLAMTGTKKLSTKIFFQYSSEILFGNPCNQIYDFTIGLNEESKEATKAIQAYVLGEAGISFKDMHIASNGKNLICFGEFLPIPTYINSNKFLKEVTKKKEWKEGEVALQLHNGDNGLEFWMCIFIGRSNEELELIPAGQVNAGFHECQKCLQAWKSKPERQIKITDFGFCL